MKAINHSNMLAIDLICGAAVIAGIGGGIYFIAMHYPHAALERQSHNHSITQANGELETLRSEKRDAANLLAQRQMQLRTSGALPSEMPVEEYFKTLSQLAATNQIHILRQNPVSPRTYPGLLEQRFAFEVSGRLVNLMQFFQEMEKIEFWADISYIRLTDGHNRPDQVTDDRSAALTISVFSALNHDPAGAKKP